MDGHFSANAGNNEDPNKRGIEESDGKQERMGIVLEDLGRGRDCPENASSSQKTKRNPVGKDGQAF